ncbi:MAG: response regulator, partial [Kiritimatiellia bacterium]|nr:response regulator [Kiritimatiellia bacterium]
MAKEKPSILIVDDEKNTREGLERALRREYRVATAESGDTALELMAEDPPDILLTDLRMPGMDGLTLVQRALARHP